MLLFYPIDKTEPIKWLWIRALSRTKLIRVWDPIAFAPGGVCIVDFKNEPHSAQGLFRVAVLNGFIIQDTFDKIGDFFIP